MPCVLVGLSRAPQFVTKSPQVIDLWADQIDTLVVPATACGGSAVLSLANSRTRIIAVQENFTKMKIPPEALGIQATVVESYLSALGIIVCDRAGIDPSAFNPDIARINLLDSLTSKP